MLSKEELLKEITFKTSRSGGKGGQNVNKVSSKVEAIFNVANSGFFTDEQKTLLLERLAKKLDTEGNLHVVSQVDRSQLINKETTILKLAKLLIKALEVQKKRRPTKIPKSIIEKRLDNKQSNAARKELRRKPKID